MTEYMKLLARSAVRFSGAPVTLSPQLDDFGIQHLLYNVSSERDTAFRVILYVANLEPHEVCITFPSFNKMEVTMKHGYKPVDKKHQQKNLSWSRDCNYLFRLPSDVSKERLTAMWTHDNFLVIQSRSMESATTKDVGQQLIPTKVCAILKPYLDIGMLIDSLWMHQCEVASIVEYLQENGLISKDRDVLNLLKDYPGKPKE